MHRKILIWGLSIALLSVIFGAFGAHALKAIVTVDKLALFETGVRYQFMHGLALIALGMYTAQNQHLYVNKGLGWSFNFFIVGILFFSGSVYALTLLSNSGSSLIPFIGPITPIGGICFMLGWVNWIRVVYLDKVDK